MFFAIGLHQFIITVFDLLLTWLHVLFLFNHALLNNKIYVYFLLKLNFDLDRGVFPMVIQAVVDEGDGRSPELH